MNLGRRFGPGDLVPSLPWWRNFGAATDAARLEAKAPLFATETPSGTVLDYRPASKFVGLIRSQSGYAYTVAEASYDKTLLRYVEIPYPRVVTAYEYDSLPIPDGSSVTVRYSEAGDWRFWLPRSGASLPPPPLACSPCPLPVDANLTLYLRFRQIATVFGHSDAFELCSDDEYTLPLTYVDLPTHGVGSLPFKAHWYYSPCITRVAYSFLGCALNFNITQRYALVCLESGRIALMLSQTGDDGGAACAATDPTGSTFGWGASPFWVFTDAINCSPLQLRAQLNADAAPPYPPGPYLDMWVYPTP